MKTRKLFTVILLTLFVFNYHANAQRLKELISKRAKLNNKSNKTEKVEEPEEFKLPKIIKFSKQPFSGNNAFTEETQFSTNDKIYGRLILDKPAKDYFNWGNDYENEAAKVNIYVKRYPFITGGEYQTITVLLDNKLQQKSYVDFDLIPTVENATTWYEYSNFFYVLLKELNGKTDEKTHDLIFTISKDFNQVGYGKLTIDITGMDLDLLEKRSKEIAENFKANRTKNRELPAVFSENHPTCQDPELSLNNIKQILERNRPGIKIDKIAYGPVNGPDYVLIKNDLAMPERKELKRDCFAAFMDENGKCKYAPVFIRREYEGGGKYGKVQARLWDEVDIECGKINN